MSCLVNFMFYTVAAVQLSGEPNKATDMSMRSLRADIQQNLKNSNLFQWPVHASLLRKLSKVVDIKSDVRYTTMQMNGSNDMLIEPVSSKRSVTLADVSVNTSKSLSAEEEENPFVEENSIAVIENGNKIPDEQIILQFDPEDKDVIVENVTVEIQHNITPKKSSLKLDLKTGTSQLSNSLLNISSQIKSVTTHKRVVSSTGPKKTEYKLETFPQVKEDIQPSTSHQSNPKAVKNTRPLINSKSPNVLIYSDSVVARDNLEASLKKVLDSDR